MSKWFGVGLVVIVAALGLGATVAQAEPHYYDNGVLMGSEPVPVVAWGTLTLRTIIDGSGVVQCHNVIGASERNPEGGGAGAGAMESFAPYACELNECPTELGLHAVVLPESLPWPTVLLLEGSTVREKMGVKVDVACLEGSTEVGGQKGEASFAPALHKGTSALHPPTLEFPEERGKECEFCGPPPDLKIEGKLKVLGYEEGEVINAKAS